MKKPLFTGSEWTLDLIDDLWKVIDKIATEKYGMSYYDPQIEIVTADQMLHHHSMNAMPLLYNHWSFGKRYEASKKAWQKGQSSIAYETIINTDPMICYIMEDNSATMQALVLAHANCGHGSFFKNNEMFLEWTDAKAVMNELKHSKRFIKECELKYGPQRVERVLDSAHALSMNGIDKYKRRRIARASDVAEKQQLRAQYEQESYDPVLDKLMPKRTMHADMDRPQFEWPFPEENILYFIEKHAPKLAQWEREIIRIVRKSSQYFYPQMMTKVMNEGWASFWHYTLMEDLYDEGYIGEGSMLEFYDSHTSVCCQYDGAALNPYVMGFNIFMDLRRACENPTEEDYKYLPLVAGKPWLETLKWVCNNFKDSDFILEFLGPNVIKKLKLFCVQDDNDKDKFEIMGIQSDDDVYKIRKYLSEQYTFESMVPSIEVEDYKYEDDRELVLCHNIDQGKMLDDKAKTQTTKHLLRLWGYPVTIKERDENGKVVKINTRRYS